MNINYDLEIERLRSENAQLKQQLEEAKWFADKMNEYVFPGETDTRESALKAFKKLTEENAALKAENEKYEKQSQIDGGRISVLISENTQLKAAFENVKNEASIYKCGLEDLSFWSCSACDENKVVRDFALGKGQQILNPKKENE